jgi:hypothetical protein
LQARDEVFIHTILHSIASILGGTCDDDTMEGDPAPLQGAGAEDFVLAEGFEGRGGHAGEGNRVAQCVEDFYGVPLCAVRGYVMVDQFDDVAATETMLRHIALQRYICVELELHSVLRVSGIRVTNFVTPDKYAVIQMGETGTATTTELVMTAPLDPPNRRS